MLVIMVLLVSTLTALEFWGLLAGITDLSIILDNVPPLLMNSFFAIKLINCLCNKYKMKELLEHIEKTWKIMHVRPENKILRFYAEESRTFTIRYMGDVVICLSVDAAKLITRDSKIDENVRIGAAYLGQLMHIYYLSAMSQRLLDHSSGLQEVIYSCDWYRISLRSRHLLKFTLMRTTKPCQIEPGKLFIMSMENFSSILKVSVSYFTVLISLQ
ncbi:odorant receptor 43a-like [Temnothorax nylanderi]|uniref:odorant receptor 43a-like n=1 Tax=Temnothorax nylanderi TaxID=102681 RepID=UPI003A89C5CF